MSRTDGCLTAGLLTISLLITGCIKPNTFDPHANPGRNELDRLQKYLAKYHLTDDLNNVPQAILMAELRGQDDLRACFNEAAPAQEVPPSCERVRRCRHADNIPF